MGRKRKCRGSGAVGGREGRRGGMGVDCRVERGRGWVEGQGRGVVRVPGMVLHAPDPP